MLEDAHKEQEVMSAVASAVKEERWADAQRSLQDLESLTERLVRGVSDKQREVMMVPTPDRETGANCA